MTHRSCQVSGDQFLELVLIVVVELSKHSTDFVAWLFHFTQVGEKKRALHRFMPAGDKITEQTVERARDIRSCVTCKKDHFHFGGFDLRPVETQKPEVGV